METKGGVFIKLIKDHIKENTNEELKAKYRWIFCKKNNKPPRKEIQYINIDN